MTTLVKICGLNAPAAVAAAAGADFGGFVFYPPSPRAVRPGEAATLAAKLPPRVRRVALFVDPDDTTLRTTFVHFRPDLVQLHGKETPERVAHIRHGFSVPVIKAVHVGHAADLDAARAYEGAVDWLLFDARPPHRPGALPGGNATSFDWSLLAGRSWAVPWMLSGGLTPENVAEAIRIAAPPAVDVSSGVEDHPGVKNPGLIAAFLAASGSARTARHGESEHPPSGT
jgi:phosphoribosylanthranilate isomerase